jgi:hypothetical protein
MPIRAWQCRLVGTAGSDLFEERVVVRGTIDLDLRSRRTDTVRLCLLVAACGLCTRRNAPLSTISSRFSHRQRRSDRIDEE